MPGVQSEEMCGRLRKGGRREISRIRSPRQGGERAVYATVEVLGKRLGLSRYSEFDRYEHPETLIMARKIRGFKTTLVQLYPHLVHWPRQLSRSHPNIYRIRA
jgi:hypothetical protein